MRRRVWVIRGKRKWGADLSSCSLLVWPLSASRRKALRKRDGNIWVLALCSCGFIDHNFLDKPQLATCPCCTKPFTVFTRCSYEVLSCTSRRFALGFELRSPEAKARGPNPLQCHLSPSLGGRSSCPPFPLSKHPALRESPNALC